MRGKIIWPFLLLLAMVMFLLIVRLQEKLIKPASRNKVRPAVPVEVAAVKRGNLVIRRSFGGTIEAQARLTVAPRVDGRIRRLLVEVAAPVKRGQVLAELDDAEFVQAEAEAKARLQVAEAEKAAALSRNDIAGRELERSRTLQKRGIASDSAFDIAQAEFLSSQAAVKVAAATCEQAAAVLAAARIRLEDTRIQAEWSAGDDERVVAERFCDEGDTVAANHPLFTIVELDPLMAVIQVGEKDYPRLENGQPAELVCDAFPDRTFAASILRIAPVFSRETRQARVELRIANPDLLLKPGMFCRCRLVLEKRADVLQLPLAALTRRREKNGVFRLNNEGNRVSWQELATGLANDQWVEILNADFEIDTGARVVVLGQQLLTDGAAVKVISAGERR